MVVVPNFFSVGDLSAQPVYYWKNLTPNSGSSFEMDEGYQRPL